MLFSSLLWISLQPSMGWEQSELRWSIANELSSNPSTNILSELQFEQLALYRLGAKTAFVTQGDGDWQFDARAEAHYLSLERGHSIDSDYTDSNRQGLYSRARAQILGDDGLEYNVSVGLRYDGFAPHYLGLQAGLYYRDQAINLQRGEQLVADPNVFAPLSLADLTERLQDNLDSDYSSEWRGYFVEGRYQWSAAPWTFSITVRGLSGEYFGQGRWNMRDNFQQPRSFTHAADDSGYEWSLGIAYDWSPTLRLNVNYQRRQWQSDYGLGRVYLSSGTMVNTRFNGAELNSELVELGVAWRWEQ